MTRVSLCFVLVFASGCYLHRLPPENHTATTMYPLKRQILKFAVAHDRLPHTLSELPPLDGFTNRTTDVWEMKSNSLLMEPQSTYLATAKIKSPVGVVMIVMLLEFSMPKPKMESGQMVQMMNHLNGR